MVYYRVTKYINYYINEEAEVLDSIVFCFDKNRVKYLGDRAQADSYFQKYFPGVAYKKIPESKFYNKREYPNLIGIIDVERGYRLKKVG